MNKNETLSLTSLFPQYSFWSIVMAVNCVLKNSLGFLVWVILKDAGLQFSFCRVFLLVSLKLPSGSAKLTSMEIVLFISPLKKSSFLNARSVGYVSPKRISSALKMLVFPTLFGPMSAYKFFGSRVKFFIER